MYVWNGCLTTGVEPYFLTALLSDFFTIPNLWHAASWIWTCVEPEFRSSWMKLWISSNQFFEIHHKIFWKIPSSLITFWGRVKFYQLISSQCSHFIPPENTRKPKSALLIVKIMFVEMSKLFPLYTPWKHQKSQSFLVFSEGVKWEHWSEMG